MKVGTVSAYTTAVYVNGTYGTITVGGATYYVDWTAAVRGYAGAGYAVDRWRVYDPSLAHLVTKDGLRSVHKATGGVNWMRQAVTTENRVAGTYTYSALIRKSRANLLVRIGTSAAAYAAFLANTTD